MQIQHSHTTQQQLIIFAFLFRKSTHPLDVPNDSQDGCVNIQCTMYICLTTYPKLICYHRLQGNIELEDHKQPTTDDDGMMDEEKVEDKNNTETTSVRTHSTASQTSII